MKQKLPLKERSILCQRIVGIGRKGNTAYHFQFSLGVQVQFLSICTENGEIECGDGEM